MRLPANVVGISYLLRVVLVLDGSTPLPGVLFSPSQ